MNTEQQLRRAAQEMDRATASLTPPPIGELRRSARMRAIGVSVAAAVGVAVLVGGAVLVLSPRGETTLRPASPTETTVVTVDGLPIVIPELDPPPSFDLGEGSQEMKFQEPGEHLSADVRRAIAGASSEYFESIDHVVFLGASGDRSAYAFIGTIGQGAPPDSAGQPGECVHTYVGRSPSGGGCGDAGQRESIMPGVSIEDDTATFIVTGRAPEGSSVIALEIDGSLFWRRTPDGYGYLAAEGSVDSRVRYIIYDVDGNVLQGTTMYTGVEEAADTTTAVPSEDERSCSGGRFFPDIDTTGLPEPVVQTLGKIRLFGSRCWFDELAGVSAGMFTASFGGMDPVELWTFEEEEGYEPMHFLMQILEMPYGTTEVDGRVLFIWPAAAAHDGDWTTVPEEDKEALRRLYDDEDFAGFESFSGYIGYRTGIYEDGDWSFFVAGD
jgi:hypothetical protein